MSCAGPPLVAARNSRTENADAASRLVPAVDGGALMGVLAPDALRVGMRVAPMARQLFAAGGAGSAHFPAIDVYTAGDAHKADDSGRWSVAA